MVEKLGYDPWWLPKISFDVVYRILKNLASDFLYSLDSISFLWNSYILIPSYLEGFYPKKNYDN